MKVTVLSPLPWTRPTRRVSQRLATDIEIMRQRITSNLLTSTTVEDDYEEIDVSNIIPSGRTRTRVDYQAAAAAMADGQIDEDSDDDEDFQAPAEDEDTEMTK